MTVEDCFTESHLPKVDDDYGEYLFVVLFSFRLSSGGRKMETAEVDMYVGRNYVVCVHRASPTPPGRTSTRTSVTVRIAPASTASKRTYPGRFGPGGFPGGLP